MTLPSGRLQNYRSDRFDGGLIRCDISAFHRDDQRIARALYAALERVKNLNPTMPADANEVSNRLEQIVRQFGEASRSPDITQSVRRVLHDVRGGSLFALIFTLSASDAAGAWFETGQFLAADHMKIMRNAIHGLDDAAVAQDLTSHDHGVAALEQRWTTASLRNQSGDVEVRFDARWQGNFAQNCYEFSTVQRIIYNLLANACRFTADQTVTFQVLGVPETKATDVRFVLENPISPSQELVLQDQLKGNYGVFGDGVTHTGEGLGLGICADFVSAAYGIADRQATLDGEYIGATLNADRFVSWFHWPMLDTAR